jgi:hypothetical protein
VIAGGANTFIVFVHALKLRTPAGARGTRFAKGRRRSRSRQLVAFRYGPPASNEAPSPRPNSTINMDGGCPYDRGATVDKIVMRKFQEPSAPAPLLACQSSTTLIRRLAGRIWNARTSRTGPDSIRRPAGGFYSLTESA